MSVRVAVVGAGPAGFFACEDLLKRDGFEVDLFDALPDAVRARESRGGPGPSEDKDRHPPL